MTDAVNVRLLQSQYAALKRENDTLRKGGHTGGGNPLGGNDMEKRVEALEKTAQDIRERLTRVETKLDSLSQHTPTTADLISATSKTDAAIASLKTESQVSIGAIRTEMQSMETRLIKWFVSTAFAMTGVATAVAFGLARLLK